MKYTVFLVLFLYAHGEEQTNNIERSINRFLTKIEKTRDQKMDSSSIVSPINIHMGLSLLHQGAGQKTSTELETLLELPSDKITIREAYKTLISQITGGPFNIWTCIVPGYATKMSRKYVLVASQFFSTGTAGVSTQGQMDMDAASKYCHGIQSDSKLKKLHIMSKSSFNGKWKREFSQVQEGIFMVGPKERVMTTMMSRTDVFAFKEDAKVGAKILRIDYREPGWSMLLVLPNQIDKPSSLTDVKNKILRHPLEHLLQGLKDVKVAVTIPKFTVQGVEFNSDSKLLDKMGAKEIFSTRGDLNNILEGESLQLTEILFEAFTSVNETGSLAGAGAEFLAGGNQELPKLTPNPHFPNYVQTTDAGATTTAQQKPNFYVNHPFLFYIIGDKDLFIFSGEVVNPALNGM